METKLKFRIWDSRTKEMVVDKNQQFDDLIIFREGELIISNRFIIMQFTGCKDKKGKEIYIGDILNWDNECTILIKDDENELGFHYEILTKKDKNIISFDIRFYRSEESAKIIGNIYENPKLLKEQMRGLALSK